MTYCYDYPRPMVTVDILVFHPAKDDPEEILLIQREKPPFEGQWAFPGGFCDMDETLETAAVRELMEETNVAVRTLHQLKTYSAVDRDPRGRTITTAFYTFFDKSTLSIQAADDARLARWWQLDDLPPLAFDHAVILEEALQKIPSLKT